MGIQASLLAGCRAVGLTPQQLLQAWRQAGLMRRSHDALMRTTLDIEDDVLAAVKELARRQGVSAGRLMSKLVRTALAGSVQAGGPSPVGVAGFRPFEAPDLQLVSNEQIDQLRDQDGL